MRIRVVSSKEEIGSLDREKIVHLAFRPSNKDIFALIQSCPNVKAIHIPSSYIRTISNSTKMFLDMQGVALLEGDVWGHRKDINEYSEIKPEVFDRIEEHKKEGLSESALLDRLGRETHLSKDLLRFLMKEEVKKR
jgi:maleate cis-trans isomerase